LAVDKKEYGKRSGYRIKGDVQAIGEELAVLSKKHRGLKGDVVWKAARKKSSAMHGEFTWDVKRAAEKCWYAEAQYLIQAITIVTYEAEVREHIGLPDDPDDPHGPVTYYERDVMKKSSRLRREALRAAVRYLKAGREKWKELADELGHIWEAIDELDPDAMLRRL
jgi:hypothetical protein